MPSDQNRPGYDYLVRNNHFVPRAVDTDHYKYLLINQGDFTMNRCLSIWKGKCNMHYRDNRLTDKCATITIFIYK